MLFSRATTSLAMVLHELASNAAKYGALSGEAGQLSVEWTVAHGDNGEPLLRIDWTEAADREVAPRGRASAAKSSQAPSPPLSLEPPIFATVPAGSPRT